MTDLCARIRTFDVSNIEEMF